MPSLPSSMGLMAFDDDELLLRLKRVENLER